jgi:hypothetical protein
MKQGSSEGSALMIRPPTKRPSNTSAQAQFSHGQPLGSVSKQFMVAGGVGLAVDGASFLLGSLQVDNRTVTEKKKLKGGHNVGGCNVKAP